MYLLDTNIVSERLKRRPDSKVQARLSVTGIDDRFISVVTLMELKRGAGLHPSGERLWAKIERELLGQVWILDFDAATALSAGILQAKLQLEGRPISLDDSMIASTALSRKLVLVSRNTCHFERIDGLQLENWFE